MKIIRIVPVLVCVCIILSYFLLIFRNSVNIPMGDDLYCLLLFTQSFQDAKSWTESLKLLFEQWVEHRIVYSRLSALVSFWLHGSVNFKTIILIGNASLVGITLIIYQLLQKSRLSAYYLVPVVLTLFSPVMYEGNLWAGAATVYMPVCFLGLLSVCLLTLRSPVAFASALFAATLATYSFGNGMFTFVAGFAVLLYLKEYRSAGLWIFIGLAATLVYFSQFETLSATNAFGWAVHFQHPTYLFYNFAAFVGGIFNYAENVNAPVVLQNAPAILAGLILSVLSVLGLFNILAIRNNDDPLPRRVKAAWLGMVIFIGITAIVIAYSRTSGQHMRTVSSRYKVYSMVAFILVYLGILLYSRRKRAVGIVFAVLSSLLLIFNYFVYYEKFVNYKSYSLSGLFNYNNHGQWRIYRGSYFEGASKLISDRISSNPHPVYHFSPVFPELTHEAMREAPVLKDVQIIENKDPRKGAVSSISISTNEYPSIPLMSEGVYLVAYNDEEIILFAANPLKNGRVNMVRQGSYYKPGFYLEENIHEVARKGAVYNLGVFCPTEKEKFRQIDHQITGI